MKKFFIILATVLLIAGLGIFTIAFAAAGFKIGNLGSVKTEENTYAPEGSFEDISIDVDTSDVKFVYAEDGEFKVVCRELANDKHEVEIEDGTLKISNNDKRKWYEKIQFFSFSKSPKMTIYLPEREYKNLKIKASTGDINVPVDEGLNFANVDIKVSTGDVNFVGNVSGDAKIKTSTGDVKQTGHTDGDLEIEVSTGDIFLKSSRTVGKLNVKTSTGDVKLDKCDAAEITIKTSTGDVKGSLLSDKIFTAKTSTGDVDVPASIKDCGECNIKTSTGDIKITIEYETED
ncbi:MAG: DUF4097 family beta strand repeat protein [Lachnospiraceae bacterium]|nr:DUF4097 family beta strand repeat protein [Lachnospiraceae bacterium]